MLVHIRVHDLEPSAWWLVATFSDLFVIIRLIEKIQSDNSKLALITHDKTQETMKALSHSC